MNTDTSEQPPPGMPPRPSHADSFFDSLRRSDIRRTDDRWIGGVAGGLAERLNVDPLVVRGVFVVMSIFGGLGFLLYGIGWVLLPEANDGRIHLQEALRGRFDAALAGAVVFAIVGLSRPGSWWGAWWDAEWLVPFTLVGLAILFIVIWSSTRKNAHRGPGGYPPAPGTYGPGAYPAADSSPGVDTSAPETSSPSSAPDGVTTASAPTPADATTARWAATSAGASAHTWGATGAAASPATWNATPAEPSTAAWSAPAEGSANSWSAAPNAGWTGSWPSSGPSSGPSASPAAWPSTAPAAQAPGPAPLPAPTKPQTPLRPRVPGPGGTLVRIMLALVLLSAAGILLAQYLGYLDANTWLVGGGVALGLLGVGVLIAGIRGRRSGVLGGLAVLLALALIPVTAVYSTQPGLGRFDWGNYGSYGDAVFAPNTSEEAVAGFSDIAAGDLTVDLRGLDGVAVADQIEVDMGAGAVTVLVPANMAIEIRATVTGAVSASTGPGWTSQVGGGAVDRLGRGGGTVEWALGGGRTVELRSPEAESGQPIIVEVDAGFGGIQINEETS